MSITHHPGEELLLSYASGAADEAVALLVASHLAMCGPCREIVRRNEAAGGSVLSDVPPIALSSSAYEAVLSRLDASTASVVRSANLSTNVPTPLQSYVGGDLESLAWRPVTKGLSFYPLDTRGDTRARLIRAEPGAAVATHSHRGEEWTLVLTGSYSDATGRYEAGDVQSTTPEITHRPIADAGPVCFNLAVTDAPLVFKGVMTRIAGWFFGF